MGEECDLLDPPDAQVVIDAEEVITLKRDAQPGSSFILKVVNGSIAANETLSISIPRVATPVYGVGVSGATSLQPRVWSARSPYSSLRTGASLDRRSTDVRHAGRGARGPGLHGTKTRSPSFRGRRRAATACRTRRRP